MRILTFLLTALCLLSCSSNQQAVWNSDRVVITGKILNAEKYPDRLKLQLKFNNLLKQRGQNTTFIPVDEQGTFRMEMRLGYPQEVLMNYRKTHHLYLTPGDSLYIELNAEVWNDTPDKELVTINFPGETPSAKLNQTMSTLMQAYQSLNYQYKEGENINQAIAKRTPDTFLEYIKQRDKNYRAVWQQFKKEHQCDANTTRWMEDILQYEPLLGMLTYVNVYQMMQREQADQAIIPDLPRTFTAFLDDYNPNDNQIITQGHAQFLEQYDQYILNGIYEEMNQNQELSSDNEALIFLTKRLKEKSSGFTNEMIRCKLYLEMLPQAPQEMLDQHIQPETFTNAYLREKVEEANQQLIAIRNAVPEEGTELIQPDSTLREELWPSILAPYAGKVIYIDFWAPWCAPCMNEMPLSAQLQQHYQGRDVVFLYLCGESSDITWRSTVISQKLAGIHYKPTMEQMDVLYEQLGIEEIPHYIIVNKNGEIVSDDAPAPSRKEEVIAAIDKFL